MLDHTHFVVARWAGRRTGNRRRPLVTRGLVAFAVFSDRDTVQTGVAVICQQIVTVDIVEDTVTMVPEPTAT